MLERIVFVVKAGPEELHRGVIAVTRRGEAPVTQMSKDFGISVACPQRWLWAADRDDGVSRPSPAAAAGQAVELREARKQIRLLE